MVRGKEDKKDKKYQDLPGETRKTWCGSGKISNNTN